MINSITYESPLGNIFLISKNKKLIGAFLEGNKPFFDNNEITDNEDEILFKSRNWLDRYFKGENPQINELDLAPSGTKFRKEVWKVLCDIPYGKTITYGEIARKIAAERGIEKMSAQAIGGALKNNPIPIIIPCHRVIGSDGSLTGYAGGLDRKIFLLRHENPDFSFKE